MLLTQSARFDPKLTLSQPINRHTNTYMQRPTVDSCESDAFGPYFEKVPFLKGVVNCQNSRYKGPPEGNSARG